MKSDFMLAFNEICQERGLPQDTVIEALKTALVSAFRRDLNLSNTQDVQVEIDPRTGESRIFYKVSLYSWALPKNRSHDSLI